MWISFSPTISVFVFVLFFLFVYFSPVSATVAQEIIFDPSLPTFAT